MTMHPETVVAADEEPPRLTLAFQKEIWREAPVVWVDARDDRELGRLEFRWQAGDGNGGTFEVALSGREYRGAITLPMEGDGWPFAVTVFLYDSIGNRMSWDGAVFVDRQVPEGTIRLESGGNREYYAEGQKVWIEFSDAHMNSSGVSGEIYLEERRIGPISFSQEGNVWKGKVDAFEEGIYRVRAEARDLAGNCRTEELSFVVDGTRPEIRTEGCEEYYLQACNWSLFVEDRWLDPGKCSAILITPSGEEELVWSEHTIFWEDDLQREDGLYEWKVRVEDLAGNITEISHRFFLHRRGSVFSLKGTSLLEENQLPIVEETIWRLTECEARKLKREVDYWVEEGDGKREYHFPEEEACVYQIVTRDASGRRNVPDTILVSGQGVPESPEKNGSKRKRWDSWLPVAVFVFPFVLAGSGWIGGRRKKKKGC